jgi:membrane-associated phospholipid phosphatase
MTRVSLASAGLVFVICANGLAPVPARADTKVWDKGSTVLVLGLGALAAGTTVVRSDATGGKQLLFTLGSTFLATEALKATVHAPRPDGSGNDGFPSGHVAIAFAAATYFAIRYNDQYPQYVPWAYGAAALTGLARVQAKKHYAQDVIAGAALGWVLGRYFTRPLDAQVTVGPAPGGAAITYTQHF